MSERRYNIIMQTPIGKRHGTITVVKKGERISGMLDILKHREPFFGKTDGTKCLISGVLTTLLRKIPFTADGTIDEKTLRLKLKGERNTFEISGVPADGGSSVI